MKKTLTAWMSALTLAGALIFPVGSVAQTNPTAAPPTQAGGKGQRQRRGERHPEIRMAIRHLEMAKNNLQKGAHDFGGHRAKALELTEHALQECRAALQSDKN